MQQARFVAGLEVLQLSEKSVWQHFSREVNTVVVRGRGVCDGATRIVLHAVLEAIP
jgi:hypothetical protein